MDICKSADDIWFKAMSLMNNTFSKKIISHHISGYDCIGNRRIQGNTLRDINEFNGMNDKQIKAVFSRYNLYEKLSK